MKRLLGLLPGLAVAVAVGLLGSFGPGEALTGTMEDALVSLRYKAILGSDGLRERFYRPGPRVVLLLVGEQDLAWYESNRRPNIDPPGWPWPRYIWKQTLYGLREAGVAAVVFDLTFSDTRSREIDYDFAEAIEQVQNPESETDRMPVILPFVFQHGFIPEDREAILQTTIPIRENRALWERPGSEWSSPVLPNSSLRDANPTIGFINTFREAESASSRRLLQHLPLLVRDGERAYPQLSLAAALALSDATSIAPGTDGFTFDGHRVPLDADGWTRIKWRPAFWFGEWALEGEGSGAVPFPHGSFGVCPIGPVIDPILRKVPIPERLAATLRGSIVVIGTSILALDSIPTPLEAEAPGPFVHGSLLGDLLADDWFVESGMFIHWGLLAAVCAAVGGASWRATGIRQPFLATVGILGSYTLLNLILFAHSRLLPLALPLAGGGITFAIVQTQNAMREARQRLVTKTQFSMFLSPAVVDRFTSGGSQSLEEYGESCEITVLWSDIRGFTPLSEGMCPEDLMQLLRIHLGRMSRIIRKHGGTLDKYIGDAVLAFFGAPDHVPDHAERALAAAREMLVELEKVNATLAERGWGPIRIGVGVNSGSALVGCLGSPDTLLNFTAIGDTVNVTQRVESLCKTFHVPLLVTSETVRRLAAPPPGLRKVGEEQVKGRERPVEIYTIDEPSRPGSDASPAASETAVPDN